MSKELTPLDALKRLESSASSYCYESTSSMEDMERGLFEEDYEAVKVLETALKEYELIKQTKIIVANKKVSNKDLEMLKNQRMFVSNLEQCKIKPLLDEKTQKKFKALEIIKEKRVNIGYLLLCDDYEEYLDDFNDRQGEGNLPSFELLTKEEYDLLKEVLL